MSNSTDLAVPEKGKDVAVRGNDLPIAETASSAVSAREKAAVEARFLKAMHHPRNEDAARQRILRACARPAFAQTVQYTKPVGAKKVSGLSIRFAEEAARNWGNLYIRADVVYEDREKRLYRVTGTDLETNYTMDTDVAIEKVVERRAIREGDEVIGSRTNTNGDKVYLKVANEDEILVKVNAHLSKARRNIILSLIPSDLQEEAKATALKTLQDRDAKDPDAAKKEVLDAFYQIGVTADQVGDILGKALTALQPADLQFLRTLYTAIRDGETTIQEVMEDDGLERMRAGNRGEKAKGPAKKGTAGLKEAITKKDEPSDEDVRREEAEMLAREQGS